MNLKRWLGGTALAVRMRLHLFSTEDEGHYCRGGRPCVHDNLSLVTWTLIQRAKDGRPRH